MSHPYIAFNAPKKDFNDTWIVKSSEQNVNGYTNYLALNGPSRPWVATIYDTIAINQCTLNYATELLAHEELQYYYSYHGDTYPYQERLDELSGKSKSVGDVGSRVMVFE